MALTLFMSIKTQTNRNNNNDYSFAVFFFFWNYKLLLFATLETRRGLETLWGGAGQLFAIFFLIPYNRNSNSLTSGKAGAQLKLWDLFWLSASENYEEEKLETGLRPLDQAQSFYFFFFFFFFFFFVVVVLFYILAMFLVVFFFYILAIKVTYVVSFHELDSVNWNGYRLIYSMGVHQEYCCVLNLTKVGQFKPLDVRAKPASYQFPSGIDCS